jgi:uncharacterized Zn finger protein
VIIEGRKIARSFWGQAWCQHLEQFSDFENRLPRGRAYVRNGSVCHLEIAAGSIDARVSGSELYKVNIEIKKLPPNKWQQVKERCAGKIGSLLELLQGKLSESVMSVVTHREEGLFPHPREISLKCSCPDWADMCKHVAAVMYGVGARLDEKPDLLFLLRGVDHQELICAGTQAMTSTLTEPIPAAAGRILADDKLAEVFGIEMAGAGDEQPVKDAVPETSTGKDVARLRKKFKLSKTDFARLVGVSSLTISKWEKTKGPLALQARTRQALGSVSALTIEQARQRVFTHR